MPKKVSKLEAKKQSDYNSILAAFPEFPPFTLNKIEYPLLSANYELFKDQKFLFQLQQQSWLASFYEEYFGSHSSNVVSSAS
jgi:hypothetical protein